MPSVNDQLASHDRELAMAFGSYGQTSTSGQPPLPSFDREEEIYA